MKIKIGKTVIDTAGQPVTIDISQDEKELLKIYSVELLRQENPYPGQVYSGDVNVFHPLYLVSQTAK